MIQFLDTNVWWFFGITLFLVIGVVTNILSGSLSISLTDVAMRRFFVIHCLLSVCAMISFGGFLIGMIINIVHYIKSLS